ncbi:hypothetical protein KM043_016858 [Ampulex compressa]|nr:hypothetical protein KM043_016858 [Ampulex compressa]
MELNEQAGVEHPTANRADSTAVCKPKEMFVLSKTERASSDSRLLSSGNLDGFVPKSPGGYANTALVSVFDLRTFHDRSRAISKLGRTSRLAKEGVLSHR